MHELDIKPKLDVLHFLVNSIHFCIDLQYISKVLPLTLLESVPRAPGYLAGLFNLAGKSIPIIDLGLRLGLYRDKNYSLDTPILLCKNSHHETGMIIDTVIGLASIDVTELQMQDDFKAMHSPLLGVINIDSELSLLINMDYLLAHSLTIPTDEFIDLESMHEAIANE